MSILSDTTLREEIEAGRLIVGGSASQVKYSAYQFTPEKVFTPGTDGAILDWTKPPADAHYVVAPGALVWVRVKGEVRMPANLTAFYWQTNTLSRRGLMLVNSSQVEPGYVGPLACLFANFGKQPVTIHPDTNVAKLIFLQLDKPAASPLALTLSARDYDRDLKDVAVAAPASFLQVSELTARLHEQLTEARKNEEAELVRFRTTQQNEMRDDVVGDQRKVLWWAAAAFAIALAGLNVLSFFQGRLRPSIESDIRDQVSAEVRSRLLAEDATASASARRDSIALATQRSLRDLSRMVDSLQKRLDARPPR